MKKSTVERKVGNHGFSLHTALTKAVHRNRIYRRYTCKDSVHTGTDTKRFGIRKWLMVMEVRQSEKCRADSQFRSKEQEEPLSWFRVHGCREFPLPLGWAGAVPTRPPADFKHKGGNLLTQL